MDHELESAIASLGDFTGLFNPFSIYAMRGIDGSSPFVGIVGRISSIAYSLLIALALAELIRILIASTGNSDEAEGYLGPLIRLGLACGLISAYSPAITTAVSIFPRIGSALLGANANDIGVQIDSALATIQIEGASQFKLWTGNLFDMAASGILAAIFSFFALILMWVLSLLQAYLFLFWFLIGPLAVTTWVFKPLNHVFQNWMMSILAVGFWSVTGSIMVSICAKAHFLDMGFASGASGNVIAACVYSLVAILMMVSTTWTANRVFGGLEFGLRAAFRNSKRAGRVVPSKGPSSNEVSHGSG